MRFSGDLRRPFSLLLASAAVLAGASTGASPEPAAPSPTRHPMRSVLLVLEIFSLGITTGTTATTYSPSENVTRLQMAAFLSRSVDGTLQRGSRRAALDRVLDVSRPPRLRRHDRGPSPSTPRPTAPTYGCRVRAAVRSPGYARATASCSRPGPEPSVRSRGSLRSGEHLRRRAMSLPGTSIGSTRSRPPAL